MTIESAESQLQKAVYNALTANSALMAVISGVYDWVPETAAYPLVSIGSGRSIPFDTCTSNGQEHVIEVHVWSQKQGRKEAKDVQSLVYNVLHKAALSVTGHQAILCLQEFSEVTKDPDGYTHHGVQRFRVITEDI
jgi:hypothetical protein